MEDRSRDFIADSFRCVHCGCYCIDNKQMHICPGVVRRIVREELQRQAAADAEARAIG